MLDGAQEAEARVAGALRGALRELAQLPPTLLPDPEELVRLLGDLPVVPLGAFVNGTATYHRNEQDITIYKSVGIGLEDIALARMLHERLSLA